MKILLLSYGVYDYDGRLRELMRVFAGLGELFAFTQGAVPLNKGHVVYRGGGYLGFIREAVAYGRRLGGIDILVLDNRKAVIPGLLLRVFARPDMMIQDCRELYIPSEVKHFAGKAGCFFEKLGVHRADVLICANQDRARFMKDLYHLDREPLVYENLRQLKYSSDSARDAQAEKFAAYMHDGEIRIISTSGCSVSRTNDVLVRNLKRVPFPCRLFLVGENSQADRMAIEKIIQEEHLENVEILGKLNQDELKYLIGVSHIGVVNYHQKDQNNKFCASGKLFEFVYEGLPVVTTTNPPLMRLCDAYGIGASDDSYAGAINTVAADYPAYQARVKAFAEAHTVQANNDTLQRQLYAEIKEKLKKASRG